MGWLSLGILTRAAPAVISGAGPPGSTASGDSILGSGGGGGTARTCRLPRTTADQHQCQPQQKELFSRSKQSVHSLFPDSNNLETRHAVPAAPRMAE